MDSHSQKGKEEDDIFLPGLRGIDETSTTGRRDYNMGVTFDDITGDVSHLSVELWDVLMKPGSRNLVQ